MLSLNEKTNIEDMVKEAGAILLNLKHNDKLCYKIHGTQVKAELDQIMNEFLSLQLAKIRPNTLIISEESLNRISAIKVNDIDECFIIDPIDGTASLVHGFKTYVIQLAYLKKGKAIYSWVYAPEYENLYVGIHKGGAFFNNIPIKVKQFCSQIIFIDNYPQPSKKIKHMMQNLSNARYKECGSIGLKICKIAEGKANIFFKDVILKDWDLIPPGLILKEAGGSILSLEKKPLGHFNNNDYSHKGVIAVSNIGLAKYVV